MARFSHQRPEWFKIEIEWFNTKEQGVESLAAVMAGFKFRPRGVIDWVISCYVLAAVLPLFGIGASGIENLAEVAEAVRLPSVSVWLDYAYSASGAGDASQWLKTVLFLALVAALAAWVAAYRNGVPSNGIPQPVFAVALFWALWIDLVTPRTILSAPFWLTVIALGAIAFIVGKMRTKEGWETALLAFTGMILVPVYCALAPLIWLVGLSEDRSGKR